MPRARNPELTEEDEKEFREIFDLMDKDKGGTLSVDEVKSLMELLGMKVKHEDVEQMIDEVDTDGSGQIDFEEFLEVMARPQQVPYKRADVSRAFRMFADKDAPAGHISPEALEKALVKYCTSQVPEDELLRLVNQLEITPDGWIDYGAKVNLFLSK